MRDARGHTYLEMIAAIAILGALVVGSAGIVIGWRRHAAGLEQSMIASEALASEMDALRARGVFAPGTRDFEPFTGSALPGARGTVSVEPFGPGLRRVRLEISWGARRMVRETIVEAR